MFSAGQYMEIAHKKDENYNGKYETPLISGQVERKFWNKMLQALKSI